MGDRHGIRAYCRRRFNRISPTPLIAKMPRLARTRSRTIPVSLPRRIPNHNAKAAITMAIICERIEKRGRLMADLSGVWQRFVTKGCE